MTMPVRTPAERRFMALWGGFAVLAAAIVVIEVVALVRSGGMRKPLGWAAARDSTGWVVRSVNAGGPAEGTLRPGDRIVAVDGDTNAARIGPRWYLRDTPGRAEYRMTVQRAGAPTTLTVPWPVVYQREEAAWSWVHLFTGVVYLTIGMLLAFARPDSEMARKAVLVTMASVAFFITLVLETDSGIVQGVPLVLALAYYFVRPMHLVLGYRFTAAFPLGDPATPGWRRFDRLFIAAGILLWLPSIYGGAVRALGPAHATAIAAAQYPLSLLYDGVVSPLTFLFAGIAGIANALVCWRNYRLVPTPDLRRRLRWVSVGIAAGLLPIVVVTPMLVLSSAAASTERLNRTVHIVNVAVVLIPLCMGYAVWKHKVLGVRVVLRAGVQYLLARNVLRVAMAAPLALIAWSIVTNPGQTVVELITGHAGLRNVGLVVLAAIALRYRARLMTRIDRRFFREAYRRDEIFTALAAAITTATDIPALARLLSSQIQAALHPGLVLALAQEGGADLRVVYSSDGSSGPASLRDVGITPVEVRQVDTVIEVHDAKELSEGSRSALERLGVDLLVPVRGPNAGLVGTLLLGAKRSEEPYTAADRRLLEETATQTGIVWENLALRQALSREQDVRRQLSARLDGAHKALVLECPRCGRCFDGDAEACPDDGGDLVPSVPTTRVVDGKYRLERILGRGGMGAVYEATDLRLERLVAVKVLVDAIFDDAVARQRFAREARASARIVHPNVVSVFDIGEFDGGAYIVLEHLRGRTLRSALLAHGALPRDTAERVLRAVLDGVEAAHAQGVVHRDLKPENVFLVESGGREAGAKVLDFGLAVARDLDFRDGDKLTRTGTVVGTLAYMAPEQFSGAAVDERADVFSLGIIACEVVTGPVDVRGPAFLRINDIVAERLRGAGTMPAHHALADAIAGALRERREDRYATVSAFRTVLLPAITALPDRRAPG